MIYIVLGIFIILCGFAYRIYRIYISYKNKQAKKILNEIKKRVKQGSEKELYLNMLDEAAYTIDVYKVIKKSQLSKKEIEELLGSDKNNRDEKPSKVNGISTISLYIGRISLIVAFLVGFVFCMLQLKITPLYSFINAIVIAQISCFIAIIIAETIRELIMRRVSEQ